MDNHLIVPNSLWDTCDILSAYKQKRMQLLCEVWILSFNFLEKLGYHAGQAWSKSGCIIALQSKWRRLGVNVYFSDVKTLILH